MFFVCISCRWIVLILSGHFFSFFFLFFFVAELAVLGLPKSLMPRLYGEKLSRVEGSLAHPSYFRRANFSYISLQNLVNRLHEKQKVGSAGRVTSLAGSHFFYGRVTLLAGPTFLHINTLARPAGSTPSRRDNQSMRERCWLGQRGQLFSLDSAGRVTLFPGTTFLHINGA